MTSLSPETRQRARDLRRSSTPAEQKLWNALRGRQFEGIKFVRQHPVGPYYADFACRSAKLIIEIDGPTHSSQQAQAHDGERTAWLLRQDYRLIRFSNEDVFGDLDPLLAKIREALVR